MSYLYSNLGHSLRSVTYQCLFLTIILIHLTDCTLESNIICRFSEPNQTVFWTGTFISGNIEFANMDRHSLKLKRIDVELIGALVHIDALSGTRFSSSAKTTRKVFFNQNNFNSTKKQAELLLANGHHQWPFLFFLNDTLPPSFKQKNVSDSYIYYYIRMKFVRSEWYRRNIQKTVPIVVKQTSLPVATNKVEAKIENRLGCRLHISLLKSFVKAGENASFDVEITNPKENLIDGISVTLEQHLKLGYTPKIDLNLLNEVLQATNQLKQSYFRKNFQLHIPQTILPTITPYNTMDKSQPPMVVNYELHFKAHLSGLFTNLQLQLPLIITNHPANK